MGTFKNKWFTRFADKAKHLLALNDKQLEFEIADGTLKEF
jgi:hypothetical protein